MSRHSESPPIDLEPVGLILPVGSEPERIGAGFNSQVWRVGERVVKITKASLDDGSAENLRATMQYEHAVLEDFIGEHIPDTTYETVDSPDGSGAHVMTIQPFVKGTSLLDFWRSGDDLDSLDIFLERCQRIFDNTGLMPDIAVPRTGFNVIRSHNILVNVEGEPILVDSTFGKIQRSKVFGSTWARCVYGGTLVARKRLEHKSR